MMFSEETLRIVKENNPELYRELTRETPTLPYWQPPPRVDRRTIIQAIYAVFNQPPAAPDDDGGDIIEGVWRNV